MSILERVAARVASGEIEAAMRAVTEIADRGKTTKVAVIEEATSVPPGTWEATEGLSGDNVVSAPVPDEMDLLKVADAIGCPDVEDNGDGTFTYTWPSSKPPSSS